MAEASGRAGRPARPADLAAKYGAAIARGRFDWSRINQLPPLDAFDAC
jgi:hypothetical protein